MHENNFDESLGYKILIDLIENNEKRKKIKNLLKEISLPDANKLISSKLINE